MGSGENGRIVSDLGWTMDEITVYTFSRFFRFVYLHQLFELDSLLYW